MASKKTSGVTAMRYATALIDTAESHKKIDDVGIKECQEMNDLLYEEIAQRYSNYRFNCAF